jgi:hypothetical protein
MRAYSIYRALRLYKLKEEYYFSATTPVYLRDHSASILFSLMFKHVPHSDQQSSFRADPLDSIKTLQNLLGLCRHLNKPNPSYC